MITGRDLLREEIGLIWGIDRREVIENVYYSEQGGLVLKPEYYYMTGCRRGKPKPTHLSWRKCRDKRA